MCGPHAQAASDGSLAVLVQKLRSQPQILTAYARNAPLRQQATVDQLATALLQLQVGFAVARRGQGVVWVGVNRGRACECVGRGDALILHV